MRGNLSRRLDVSVAEAVVAYASPTRDREVHRLRPRAVARGVDGVDPQGVAPDRQQALADAPLEDDRLAPGCDAPRELARDDPPCPHDARERQRDGRGLRGREADPRALGT